MCLRAPCVALMAVGATCFAVEGCSAYKAEESRALQMRLAQMEGASKVLACEAHRRTEQGGTQMRELEQLREAHAKHMESQRSATGKEREAQATPATNRGRYQEQVRRVQQGPEDTAWDECQRDMQWSQRSMGGEMPRDTGMEAGAGMEWMPQMQEAGRPGSSMAKMAARQYGHTMHGSPPGLQVAGSWNPSQMGRMGNQPGAMATEDDAMDVGDMPMQQQGYANMEPQMYAGHPAPCYGEVDEPNTWTVVDRRHRGGKR